MSAADTSRYEREVMAALLWDVPTLRRGSASARDFAAALPGQVEKWWEPKTFATDVLGRAARAVAYERADDIHNATAGYKSLVNDHDALARLLGAMLMAWSATADGPEEVREAHRLAREAKFSADVRARLLAKVAAYALDKGQAEICRASLREAIELAPDRSRLWNALAVVGLNAGLPNSPLPSPEADPAPQDPLVDYPWIDVYSLEGAQRALKAEVERRARRASTSVVIIGGTPPFADVVAAEIQATWAGALWLRPAIRLQLGAHLLTGAASSSRQWAYGLLMWTLGAGSSPDDVYRYVEPHLTQDDVEFVLRELRAAQLRGPGRLLTMASAACDAISDEAFEWLITEVTAALDDVRLRPAVLGVWAMYAARLPDEWFSDFVHRDQDFQLAVVASLPVGAVARLPDPAQLAIFDIARSALEHAERADVQLMRIAAATVPARRRAELVSLLGAKAGPGQLPRLDDEQLAALPPSTLQHAKDVLIATVRRQQADAREGTVYLDPAHLDLARVVVYLDADPAATSLLMEIAGAADQPGEFILAARRGLTLLRRAGQLPAPERRALHHTDDSLGTYPHLADVPPDLLRAARLQVIALELTEDEAANVVTACRAPETRVRITSLSTCAEVVAAQGSRRDHGAFVWALVGGLFDPDDEAVTTALRGLPDDLLPHHAAASKVAVTRLLPLLEEGSLALRIAVAHVTRRWMTSSERHDSTLREISDRLRTDKSWHVRTLDAQMNT